jgi:hypothetical protein
MAEEHVALAGGALRRRVYALVSLRVNRSAIGGVPRSIASKIWWMRLTWVACFMGDSYHR